MEGRGAICYTPKERQKIKFPELACLVGKWFPHPVGVFCTILEPPKCHIMPNSDVSWFNLITLHSLNIPYISPFYVLSYGSFVCSNIRPISTYLRRFTSIYVNLHRFTSIYVDLRQFTSMDRGGVTTLEYPGVPLAAAYIYIYICIYIQY